MVAVGMRAQSSGWAASRFPTGGGVLWSLDGTEKRYEGDWPNGIRHGWGKEFNQNSLVYANDWRNDKRDGNGIQYQWIGQQIMKVYEGEWRDSKWHGQGQAFYHTGRLMHMGSWVNGVLHGRGIEFPNDGQLVYEGEWTNGQKTNRGEGKVGGMQLMDGMGQVLTYTGCTVDGRPHGWGKLRSSDDVIYNGTWAYGIRHGYGTAYYTHPGAYEKGRYEMHHVAWFSGEWRHGKVHNGTFFPDGHWHGDRGTTFASSYQVTPIPWQAGREIPNIDLRPPTGSPI